ncbi:MAG: hypothetical protein KC439_04595 [Yoonia sp.]|nr:hypothetical protein [Yoonia sp.]
MRDYDPTLGRYLQADPLGLVDEASVYGYALQNPGRYTDPRGENALVSLIAPIVVEGLKYCGKRIVQSIVRGGMSQAATAGQGAAIAGGIAAATAGTEACGCDEEPKEDKCDKQFDFHLDIVQSRRHPHGVHFVAQ